MPSVTLPGAYQHAACPPRLLRREATYRRALLLSDVLAAVVALELSLNALGTDDRLTFLSVLVAVPLLVLLGKLHGLYDRDDLLVRKTTVEEIPKLFQHATLAALVVSVFDTELGIGQVGDTQTLLLFAMLLTAAIGGRLVARAVAGRILPAERILVLGGSDAEHDLRERAEGRINVEFVGAIPLEQITSHEDLRRIVKAHDVDRVVIVPTAAARTPELVRASKAAGVRVSILPGVLDVVGSQVEFDDVFGVTLLGVRRFGLTRSARTIKRAFDLLAAMAIGFVVLPTIAIVALAIKRDTPGPVFFRQQRVGHAGRRFWIIKFRTMVDGADQLRSTLADRNEVDDGMFKISDDPRVTRVGRILRKLHLDELPQLWNVLRGDMSLVGPRPLVIDEDERITGLDRRRLELTPGMTGPWQILGADRRVSMSEMLKLDYLYAANWSLWNDTKLLLRTAGIVARRRGV
ncbi:exopolysaccharide biosynthesis polyprenyl glycosylphosphotransferase [Paraconexibacter sp.]|uniref:exopolysaccharide biosynthesis polyprenyl glycosylphosphotransferase n=1 Tax=Paraconexibacter sp. TaxID=2949640 RepID=UPI00356222AD